MVFHKSLTLLITLLTTACLVLGSPCPSTAASKNSGQTVTKNAAKQSGKININTAGAAELTQVTGIGPKTAENIIAYRKKHGKFKNIQELQNVKGIGEKTLKKIKPYLKT